MDQKPLIHSLCLLYAYAYAYAYAYVGILTIGPSRDTTYHAMTHAVIAA